MNTSSNRVWLRTGFVGVLAVSLVFLVGCGKTKKESSISGKVTYGDKPVTGGSIQLHPVEGKGQPFLITIAKDGTFSAKGAPVGEMKVTVETESIRGMTGGNPYAGQMKGGMKPPGDNKLPEMDTSNMFKYVKIPLIYAKPETTPLIWTVEPGATKKDINLIESGK
jgi:hypothetical protein